MPHHTWGSMERIRRQSHQRLWRRPLYHEGPLRARRIQKGKRSCLLATWNAHTDVTGHILFCRLLNQFEVLYFHVKMTRNTTCTSKKERPRLQRKTKKFVMGACESADYRRYTCWRSGQRFSTGTFHLQAAPVPTVRWSRDQTVFVDDTARHCPSFVENNHFLYGRTNG